MVLARRAMVTALLVAAIAGRQVRVRPAPSLELRDSVSHRAVEEALALAWQRLVHI